MSVDTGIGTLRKHPGRLRPGAVHDQYRPRRPPSGGDRAGRSYPEADRPTLHRAEREHTDQQFRSEREHTDQKFAAIDHRFTAERHHTYLRFDAVIAEFRASTRTILEAFASFTAHNDVASLRVQCGELNVRVSLLEAEIRRK